MTDINETVTTVLFFGASKSGSGRLQVNYFINVQKTFNNAEAFLVEKLSERQALYSMLYKISRCVLLEVFWRQIEILCISVQRTFYPSSAIN